MIGIGGVLLYLASYGYFGQGTIGELFNYWEQAGVFSYVLPFLIIFCLVFATLSKIKVFEDNKAISAIISLAVALLALQFDIVPIFFAELFPRIGIGLSIILAILVLIGLFFDPRQKILTWGLFGVGVLILVAVLYDTAGFTYGYYLYYVLDPQILSWILFIALIIGVVAAMSKKKRSNLEALKPLMFFPNEESASK